MLRFGQGLAKQLGITIQVEWSLDDYNVPEDLHSIESSIGGIYDWSRDVICLAPSIGKYSLAEAEFFLAHEVGHAYEARILADQAFFPNMIVRVGRSWRVADDFYDKSSGKRFTLIADDIVDFFWNYISDFTINRTLHERFSLNIPLRYFEKCRRPKFNSSLPFYFDCYEHGEDSPCKAEIYKWLHEFPGGWKMLRRYLAPLKINSPPEKKIRSMKMLFKHFANGIIDEGTCSIEQMEKVVRTCLPEFWRRNDMYKVLVIGRPDE